jgi:hypothetical protein
MAARSPAISRSGRRSWPGSSGTRATIWHGCWRCAGPSLTAVAEAAERADDSYGEIDSAGSGDLAGRRHQAVARASRSTVWPTSCGASTHHPVSPPRCRRTSPSSEACWNPTGRCGRLRGCWSRACPATRCSSNRTDWMPPSSLVRPATCGSTGRHGASNGPTPRQVRPSGGGAVTCSRTSATSRWQDVSGTDGTSCASPSPRTGSTPRSSSDCTPPPSPTSNSC